ncbi:MAG: SIR2 family protein [Planctomycetes bacterium]|nr:SIR2 family protein [Planctomycetota bacterium]
MTEQHVSEAVKEPFFSFFKGAEDVIAPKDGFPCDWERAAAKVREHLNDAMNARHVGFLLGSGCSSLAKDGKQVGIPTMMPMASAFLRNTGKDGDLEFMTQVERDAFAEHLGIDVNASEFSSNLERLLEVLHCIQFILKRSTRKEFADVSTNVNNVVTKITRYIVNSCSAGEFSNGDESVINLYQAFYRKLVYRDRALPRPWVFTTNYDLFNETAMDRLGTPYSNGFSGTVERRFNPATFRYSLAEQLDVSNRKWTSVDSYVYLCKLHGSINWIEEGKSLFPIREVQRPIDEQKDRVMIFPTPAKQNASIGYPYSDLFREFQGRIVRDQSVLFVLGYSFADEHINNIIFQALTIPTFRLIAFLSPKTSGVTEALLKLGDPRVWIIGGSGPSADRKAHYFDTFVEKFMPEPPGDVVDTAVAKVLQELFHKAEDNASKGGTDDN